MSLAKKIISLNEAKLTPKEFVEILRGDDFGKTERGGNGEAILQKGKIIVRDSYWVGGQRALDDLRKSWSPTGFNYEYFKNEYGISVRIKRGDIFMTDGIMYGKRARNGGVVELELEIH